MSTGALPLPCPGVASGALARLEGAFDFAFAQRLNPWRHLGALGFLCFWVCAATGIWIYVGFDTSAAGAWESVAAMDRDEWPLGALARALHRYSADAMVLVVACHLARELARRHFAGVRRFAWLTGVALLVPLLAAGIGGYWLAWDQMGQWSLTATTEWLDALPFFDGALTRNVIAGEQVTDRLFSLFVFLHIGIPLALLALMWAHVQRVSPARSQPPRALAAGTCVALVLLCIARPIALTAPADLSLVPARLPVDWFFLFPHAAMATLTPSGLWLAAAFAFAALALLPFAIRVPRAPVARVDLANCNGCARCFADCPFGAIVMAPRSDERHHRREARVDAGLCAGCGICTGACPSSTPFRAGEALATGIDMPSLAIGAQRARLEARSAALSGHPRVVVFGCRWAANAAVLEGPATAAFPFLCAGMVPPSFVEYALRAGAEGVLVVACREGDCEFRTGDALAASRLDGLRAPRLRPSVPRDRVRLVHAGFHDAIRLRAQYDRFLDHLRRLAPQPAHRGLPPKRQETRDG
jgi:quinol-cytochrome oxidoreductase complex cytochrome b subunit/coenzyme F420-reducing hydrogenase delta subunit